MYVKSVKRKCDVRGCKNKECFAVSKGREFGNTPIICKSCLADALKSIEDCRETVKDEKKGIPKLFYNEEAFAFEEEKPKEEARGEEEKPKEEARGEEEKPKEEPAEKPKRRRGRKDEQ